MSGFSTTFAAPQSHRLPILLQLSDQGITLLDDVCILFVLVIWPIGLDDTINPVDCACNPLACDEFGEVPVNGFG